MTDSQPSGNVLPPEVYGVFAGLLDQVAVQRFHNAITVSSQGGVKKIHLLFQTSGGLIGEGISLYNLFRASPVEITLYNVGSVSSIGVIAFLGAHHRKVSAFGSFMIHRAYLNPVGITADKMTAAAGQLAMEDSRVEAILKEHTKIPQDKWDQHKYADVWISAADGIAYKIADGYGEFAPPPGTTLFNVWPPQQ